MATPELPDGSEPWTPPPPQPLDLDRLTEIVQGRLKDAVRYTPFTYYGNQPKGIKTLSPRALTDFVIAITDGNDPDVVATVWRLEEGEAIEFVMPTPGLYSPQFHIPHPQNEDASFPLSPINLTIANLVGTPGFDKYRAAAKNAIMLVSAAAQSTGRAYQDVLDDPPDDIAADVALAGIVFGRVGEGT